MGSFVVGGEPEGEELEGGSWKKIRGEVEGGGGRPKGGEPEGGKPFYVQELDPGSCLTRVAMGVSVFVLATACNRLEEAEEPWLGDSRRDNGCSSCS